MAEVFLGHRVPQQKCKLHRLFWDISGFAYLGIGC